MLLIRRSVGSSLGKKHGRVYRKSFLQQVATLLLIRLDDIIVGVAAMLVESAAPYAIVSLTYIILYGRNNTAQNLFLPLLVQVEVRVSLLEHFYSRVTHFNFQCLSPILIFLRVANGQDWDRSTAGTVSHSQPFAKGQSLVFASHQTAETSVTAAAASKDRLAFSQHADDELEKTDV